jgi:hypothetical protein
MCGKSRISSTTEYCRVLLTSANFNAFTFSLVPICIGSIYQALPPDERFPTSTATHAQPHLFSVLRQRAFQKAPILSIETSHRGRLPPLVHQFPCLSVHTGATPARIVILLIPIALVFHGMLYN